jgi:serine protease Do
MKSRTLLIWTLALSLPAPLFAESGLWKEGRDHPEEKVNIGLKSVTPDAFIRVSEKVDAAVVNISTTQIIQAPGRRRLPGGPRGPQMEPFDPFFSPFWEFFGDDFPAPPQQDLRRRSLGSGFFLNEEGYIVTNNHVVEKADEIKVVLEDDSQFNAKVVGRDPRTDVALIKIDAKKKLPHVLLGDSAQLKVGEIVIAIGNPFGLSHSVTQGIVSAKERSIGFGAYDDFIQTDASINPGNSGGPLLNLQGEVVGINTAIVASGQGIGFAIPINLAKEILAKLRSQGKVVRGWLGVSVQKLGDEHVAALKLPNRKGALVSDVLKGSPAEQAGLKAGDVIVRFDGQEIREMDDLPVRVAATPVGKQVRIDVIRDGKPATFEAKVGELKGDDESQTVEQKAKADPLGLTVGELTAALADRLGLGNDLKGVVVKDVDESSPAFERGIRTNDVILEIDRKRTPSVAIYRQAVSKKKKGDSVLVLLRRGPNVTLYVAFTL